MNEELFKKHAKVVENGFSALGETMIKMATLIAAIDKKVANLDKRLGKVEVEVFDND